MKKTFLCLYEEMKKQNLISEQEHLFLLRRLEFPIEDYSATMDYLKDAFGVDLKSVENVRKIAQRLHVVVSEEIGSHLGLRKNPKKRQSRKREGVMTKTDLKNYLSDVGVIVAKNLKQAEEFCAQNNYSQPEEMSGTYHARKVESLGLEVPRVADSISLDGNKAVWHSVFNS